MTDYAVGDIQGCHDSLATLLNKVNFDPNSDKLYCVGDLVNRGPKSLETLKLLHSLGSCVDIVLGNHDLHLIFCFYKVRNLKSKDTAHEILDSPEAEFWINWLKQFPLIIYNSEKDFIISHAGLFPKWSLEQALLLSKSFNTFLNNNKSLILLDKIYGDHPNTYTEELSNIKKLRFSVNAFTRMRYCYSDLSLNFSCNTFPSSEKDLSPWFTFPRTNIDKKTRIIFGHWSSLGLYHSNNNICVDTGCVWGNELTLYDIDNDRFIHQNSID